MFTPEDLDIKLGGWSNFNGYEVRVSVKGYLFERTLTNIGTRWLQQRSGAKQNPSFGKVKLYLKSLEGKQFIYACMRNNVEYLNKDVCGNRTIEQYYGFKKLEGDF